MQMQDYSNAFFITCKKLLPGSAVSWVSSQTIMLPRVTAIVDHDVNENNRIQHSIDMGGGIVDIAIRSCLWLYPGSLTP